MPLILGTNSIKDTGYDVANSCRFDDGSSTQMNKTISSTSTTWTFSCWIKLNPTGTNQYLASWDMGGGEALGIGIEASTNQLFIYTSATGQAPKLYDGKLRDPSAWMNIVIKNSSGTITSYINGTQAKTSITGTALASGTLRIGCFTGSNYFYDGYMSEVVLIDGTAYNADSFGEFDEDSGIWKPIDVSGLTFGTNGFYLDYEDSGDLGDDESGNGNDFTEVNLAATDQMIDTCTKNFPIQNSIAGTSGSVGANTYTEGNLQVLTPQGENGNNFSTIGVSSGKWYGEFYIKANSGIERSLVGVSGDVMATLLAENNMGSLSGARDVGYMGNDGDKFVSGTESSYGGSAFSVGDVIGVALDLDNRTVNFAQNNSFKGTISIASTGIWHMGCGDVSGGARATIVANYGQDSSFAGSITAANNTDEHSEGLFKYSPPSGFITLNSTNLGEYGG